MKGATKFADGKNMLAVGFFYLLNKVVCCIRYRSFAIKGGENIPKSGPFLLIANHTSRWDGLVLMETIGRSANWMVSPNELKGLQGIVLRSVGSFPAERTIELMNFIGRTIKKGEPVVIFPEGNIFRDGSVHTFKAGAARILLMAHEMNIRMPVVSAVIDYDREGSVRVKVSAPLWLNPEFIASAKDHHQKVVELTADLHRKLNLDRQKLLASSIPAEFVRSESSRKAS